MKMFLLTLQQIPVSLSLIVTEIWPGQKFECFLVLFGQNFNNYWYKWILSFCCTTLVGMLFMDFFSKYVARKVLEDMARNKVEIHTDIRANVHARWEEQYMSPALGDI